VVASSHTSTVRVPHVRTSVRGLTKTGRSPSSVLLQMNTFISQSRSRCRLTLRDVVEDAFELLRRIFLPLQQIEGMSRSGALLCPVHGSS